MKLHEDSVCLNPEERPPMAMRLPIPFDVKAYGKVLTWEYGPPGVYYVSSTDFEGWVIDRNVNTEIPMQADQYGERGYDGNLVYFDSEHGRLIVDYEVLACRLKTCPPEHRERMWTDLVEASTFGAEDITVTI
ncbi:hypothetical protein CE91St43_04580 [Oscillospiraceae bacterium]|nr:hypothetical protein CE91St43_04580 [Oscillospiraceae bacterium]